MLNGGLWTMPSVMVYVLAYRESSRECAQYPFHTDLKQCNTVNENISWVIFYEHYQLLACKIDINECKQGYAMFGPVVHEIACETLFSHWFPIESWHFDPLYYTITGGIIQRLPFITIADLKLWGWVYSTDLHISSFCDCANI